MPGMYYSEVCMMVKKTGLIGFRVGFYGTKKIGKTHSGGEYKGVMGGCINEVMPMFKYELQGHLMDELWIGWVSLRMNEQKLSKGGNKLSKNELRESMRLMKQHTCYFMEQKEARMPGFELVRKNILADVVKSVNRQQIMRGFVGFCKNSYLYSGK